MAIAENVKPFAVIFQQNYGLPSHFWDDEAVLGTFQGLMGMHIKRATKSQLTGQKFDVALMEGWQSISGLNGQVLWKNSAQLTISQDLAFLEAYDTATSVVLLADNLVSRPENCPEIVQLALEESNGNQPQAAESLMLHMMSALAERLGVK